MLRNTGSKPDQDMWRYFTKNMDFSTMSKRGGDFFKSDDFLGLYASIATELKVVHGCTIKYNAFIHEIVAAQGGWKSKTLTSIWKKHPVSRLEESWKGRGPFKNYVTPPRGGGSPKCHSGVTRGGGCQSVTVTLQKIKCSECIQ